MKKSEMNCFMQKINFLCDFISKIGLTFWQLTVKPMALVPFKFQVATQLRQFKEFIDYELKSADNPYVLTNFCKLLSLTHYTKKT